MLNGSEVKSIRNNKISIEEAYARVDDHEVWLVDCDIAEYAQASIYNHARTRKRKLLLKRREIRKFAEGAENDGLTLIPLQVFFQRGLVKVRWGFAKAGRCMTSDKSCENRTIVGKCVMRSPFVAEAM